MESEAAPGSASQLDPTNLYGESDVATIKQVSSPVCFREMPVLSHAMQMQDSVTRRP